MGPASAIVEMIGHRLLPLLNSAISVALWAGLSWWLVPGQGAWGMAIAMSVAVIVPAYVAMIELRISDGISPFDALLLRGLAVALVGLAAMWAPEWLFDGPARFATLLVLWAAVSWACPALWPLARRPRRPRRLRTQAAAGVRSAQGL